MNVDLAHLMYNAAQRQKAWVDGKVDCCVLYCVTVCYRVLLCVALCCIVLQCLEVCCSECGIITFVIQRGAASEGEGGCQCRWLCVAVCGSMLPCAAVCYRVLQCDAV